MNMNAPYGRKIISKVLAACLMLLITSCSTHSIVDSKYIPEKILVTYKPIIINGKEATCYLIETSKGLAIYESFEQQNGSICSMHWDDEKNDYIGCYEGRRDAWRYVVPKDRKKDARRYYYGIRAGFPKPKYINGGFEIDTINGVEQVIEKDPFAIPSILSPE